MKLFSTYQQAAYSQFRWIVYLTHTYTYTKVLSRNKNSYYVLRVIQGGDLTKSPIGEP